MGLTDDVDLQPDERDKAGLDRSIGLGTASVGKLTGGLGGGSPSSEAESELVKCSIKKQSMEPEPREDWAL